jgi:hypothetical protein
VMYPYQPSPRPSPPLTRGERAGSGGILHAQEFVNSVSAIGIRRLIGYTPIIRTGYATESELASATVADRARLRLHRMWAR